jgi:hypothetical protein
MLNTEDKHMKIRKPNIGKTMKILAIVAIFLLIASLIPLLAVSRYNVPKLDDYWHGLTSSLAWAETGSVTEVVRASVEWSRSQYHGLNGVFTHTFLMSLIAPFMLNNQWLVGYISILSLVLSVGFLSYTTLRKVFSGELWASLLVATVTAMCAVWSIPSAVESFYWQSAALTYTLGMSLFFLIIALTIRLVCGTSRAFAIFYVCFAPITVVFYSGLNMVTSFGSATLSLMFVAFVIATRRRLGNSDKPPVKRLMLALIPTVLGLAAFAAVVAAPGNAARQWIVLNIDTIEGELLVEALHGTHDLPPAQILTDAGLDMTVSGGGTSAMTAISDSLIYGLKYPFTAESVTFTHLLVLLLIPVFAVISRTAKRDFKYPLVVSLLSYLWFSSLACPTFYSQQAAGDPRVVGAYSNVYTLLIVFNALYWVGWVCRNRGRIAARVRESEFGARFVGLRERINPSVKRIVGSVVCFLLTLLFTASFVGSIYLGAYTVPTAVSDLTSGNAAAFRAEWEVRLLLLNDPEIRELEFMPYEGRPRSLLIHFVEGGLAFEAQVANFFDKDSIVFLGMRCVMIRDLQEALAAREESQTTSP